MTNNDVPRGTAPTPRWTNTYPTVAPVSGPGDTILYTAPPLLGDISELNRRRLAAGYAHIARLTVDGGPIVEPKPIRRRLALEAAGLIGIAICALGAVVALWGVMG